MQFGWHEPVRDHTFSMYAFGGGGVVNLRSILHTAGGGG
jgi:hypothetical protein